MEKRIIPQNKKEILLLIIIALLVFAGIYFLKQAIFPADSRTRTQTAPPAEVQNKVDDSLRASDTQRE